MVRKKERMAVSRAWRATYASGRLTKSSAITRPKSEVDSSNAFFRIGKVAFRIRVEADASQGCETRWYVDSLEIAIPTE